MPDQSFAQFVPGVTAEIGKAQLNRHCCVEQTSFALEVAHHQSRIDLRIARHFANGGTLIAFLAEPLARRIDDARPRRIGSSLFGHINLSRRLRLPTSQRGGRNGADGAMLTTMPKGL